MQYQNIHKIPNKKLDVVPFWRQKVVASSVVVMFSYRDLLTSLNYQSFRLLRIPQTLLATDEATYIGGEKWSVLLYI